MDPNEPRKYRGPNFAPYQDYQQEKKGAKVLKARRVSRDGVTSEQALLGGKEKKPTMRRLVP